MKHSSIFQSYGNYYDKLYDDKDYETEAGYIDSLLKNNDVSGNKILEFGSGTGRHGSFLVEKGYQITGIEKSHVMLQKTNKKDGLKCIQGDIRTISLDQNYDAVLALFHVMSYQTTNMDVSRVFCNAFKHLEKGGLFIFDVWYSPAVHNLKLETRLKSVKNDEIEIIRIAEPNNIINQNRVDVEYIFFVKKQKKNNYKKFCETHPMRHFTILEMDNFANTAGFKRINAQEFMTGNLPGSETWSVCFIYKKLN